MEIQWIRLYTGILQNAKVRRLRAQPEGDTLFVSWISLLCRAGIVNDNGRIYLLSDTPYNAEDLAMDTDISIEAAEKALTLLEKLHMIAYDEDGMLVIPSWEEHQNIDGMNQIREQNRERQRRFKQRQKEALSGTQAVPERSLPEAQLDAPVEEIIAPDVQDASYMEAPLEDPAEAMRYASADDGSEKITFVHSSWTPDQSVEIEAAPEDFAFVQQARIDSAWKTEKKARQKTAHLLADEIVRRGQQTELTSNLHEAVMMGLDRGLPPEQILAFARSRSWSEFASTMAVGREFFMARRMARRTGRRA